MLVAVDIETYQDNSLPKLVEKFIERKTQRLKDPSKIIEYTEKYRGELALSPLTGKIICINAIVAEDIDLPFDVLKPISKFSQIIDINESTLTEEQLLKNFNDFIKTVGSPLYLTYNGKKFDFPYIMIRASKYNINISLPIELYKTERHIDLLNNFFGQGSLKEWGYFYGITDIDGSDGSEIAEMFEKGDYQSIQNKCYNDCLVTLNIYKKLYHIF